MELAAMLQCHILFPIAAFCICCGVGNLARSRLLGGFFVRCASLRRRRRRLKAGGSQDWLPHDLCRMVARIKKYVALGESAGPTGARASRRNLVRKARWQFSPSVYRMPGVS